MTHETLKLLLAALCVVTLTAALFGDPEETHERLLWAIILLILVQA